MRPTVRSMRRSQVRQVIPSTGTTVVTVAADRSSRGTRAGMAQSCSRAHGCGGSTGPPSCDPRPECPRGPRSTHAIRPPLDDGCWATLDYGLTRGRPQRNIDGPLRPHQCSTEAEPGPRAQHDRHGRGVSCCPRGDPRGPARDRLPRQPDARHGLRAPPRGPSLVRRVARVALATRSSATSPGCSATSAGARESAGRSCRWSSRSRPSARAADVVALAGRIGARDLLGAWL